ncbi:MAG: aminopeptidase [Candidatus Nanohaloarchaeota archaeon QJJ-7]|nr:aminopeptidase [Candidatus Nanohaloarchaeota archaeon QJJ-7]
MSLRQGAETVVDQCLAVEEGEEVVVMNDGNDLNLVEALLEVVESRAGSYGYFEFEEPERHGEEPPERVSDALLESDAFIAPTQKSISHTEARRNATGEGVRGATMPGITREIWTGSLSADYEEIAGLCLRVYERLEGAEEARIETPSGTDLELEIVEDYFLQDTGMLQEPGDFGNLPAGEVFGAPVNASGVLVIDHFPHAPDGTRVEIEDNMAVSVEHPGNEESELAEAFEDVEGARNLAEFGIGANPEAELIGNTLQDEKVLGTVHFAFGDNSSMVPEGDERRVGAEVHWDSVCEDPTVSVDGEFLLDEGEPLFLQ